MTDEQYQAIKDRVYARFNKEGLRQGETREQFNKRKNKALLHEVLIEEQRR